MPRLNSTSIVSSNRRGVVEYRQYPFAPWSKLKPAVDLRQGQHALTVGGTGSGKSTVVGEFLPRREQVVVMVSKGKDPIFEGPYYRDYDIIKKWPPSRKSLTRVMLWPPNLDTIRKTNANKTNVFAHAFDDILLNKGHWCIAVDEEHYMADELGLAREITNVLEQGRSAGISMWNNTQRPAGIPLATYVNSSHAFLFQSQEDYDVKRLGSIRNNHTHAAEMMANIQVLESYDTHEMIYMDRTGKIPPVRTIVELRKR